MKERSKTVTAQPLAKLLPKTRSIKLSSAKRRWAAICIGGILLLLSGCAKDSNAEGSSPATEVGRAAIQAAMQVEEGVTSVPAVVDGAELLNGMPVIGERVVVDGKMQSYLTGEWKAAEVVTRRPMAVTMNNSNIGLPYYGLSNASIIYEAPGEGGEGGNTKLMPIFEDYDDLERIGPVRGCRDYQLYVALGYEAIFCNFGLAVPYVAELINSDAVDNISVLLTGIEVGADEAYLRVAREGYATEYTGYLSVAGYEKAVERLGYERDYSDHFIPQFTFAAENTRAEYNDYPEATIIYPGGNSTGTEAIGTEAMGTEAIGTETTGTEATETEATGTEATGTEATGTEATGTEATGTEATETEATANRSGYQDILPHFEYHEEDQLYYRYQSGVAMIDEQDGAQYAVSNVVLQYSHGEVRDDNGYMAFEVHGEGDVLIFTNGRVIEGTWERYGGDGTPAKYYDKAGNEIVVNQGKTWICTIWQEQGEWVLYE